MRKYLVLTKDSEKDGSRAEVIFKFKQIKFECERPGKYMIYTNEPGIRGYLNGFDYMACIETV